MCQECIDHVQMVAHMALALPGQKEHAEFLLKMTEVFPNWLISANRMNGITMREAIKYAPTQAMSSMMMCTATDMVSALLKYREAVLGVVSPELLEEIDRTFFGLQDNSLYDEAMAIIENFSQAFDGLEDHPNSTSTDQEDLSDDTTEGKEED